MESFKFELGDEVAISSSGEMGKIVGRVEYLYRGENEYLVHYKAADGRAVEAWWEEPMLETAP